MIMKYSLSEILNQLIRHEGIVLEPYKDTEYITTIGIGRNLIDRGIDPFELQMIGFKPDLNCLEINHIRRRDAIWLCINDIFRCENEMLIFFPEIEDISKNRQLVLIDMLFNLGLTKFKRFKRFWDAMYNKNYDKASDEMLDSKWAKQVKNRAIILSEMMKNG